MLARKCMLPTSSLHRKFQNASTSSSIVRSQWLEKTCHLQQIVSRAFSQKACDFKMHNQFIPRKHCIGNLAPKLTSREYSTKNLFRLTESSASQLQPFLDIENLLRSKDALKDSVNKRQITRRGIEELQLLFDQAQEFKSIKERTQKLREENTTQCQELMREDIDKDQKTEKLRDLKERGRILREEVRVAENKFNEINDNLVDFILSLPNVLDRETPPQEALLVKEVKSTATPAWEDPEYTAIETQCGPGLLAEFPIGQAAWLDVNLRGRAQRHLLDGGFVETGNAEYVKRLILQGAGIDDSQFLRIREPNVKRGWEHATYLAGGASFPSFLALFAQSVIEDPKELPLRYFVIGRSYESQRQKPGFYQSHVVQAFVACRNEEEMESEFLRLQNLMEAFYAEKVGFDFQTQSVPAPRLQMYERKKLAFVMNKTDKSPSKMIGTLSTVGDYVSKRLLCCYFDDKKKTQFLHLVSAKFFDITHFLRSPSPKIITHSDILAKTKPQPEILKFERHEESESHR